MANTAPETANPATPAPGTAPETVIVTTSTVACDGGEGALGHPRVYLNLGADGKVECPYCDRLFLHANAAQAA